MNRIYEKIQTKRPKKSAFDLSHERKMSFKMGELVPCFLEEVLPGDHFKVKTETMMRLAPMLAPVMHRLNVFVHYFFVPNRIIWSSWEDFITGGKAGDSTPTMPTKTLTEIGTHYGGSTEGKLADYLGLPSVTNGAEAVSQLPFRAYQQIYNDFFMDPNLGTAIDVSAGGDDILDIQKRAWEKDYFTSALPWTQRGDATTVSSEFSYKDTSTLVNTDGSSPTGGLNDLQYNGSNELVLKGDSTGRIENIENDSVEIDLIELRRAAAVQRYLEVNARGGWRYVEQLLSHFGVDAKDYRLQRAEYLGGGKQPIVFSEVLNTSATATEPQGDMAGHGISVGDTNQFSRYFTEHGYVMGIMSVLPRTVYQQGIPKTFSRTEKLDYYFPEFADLGEQEVANKELYYAGTSTDATADNVFGYQQRYCEYKNKPSTVHGDFRSSLDFWHLSRKFNSAPALNNSFIEADPDTRIFANESGDHLWCQLYNQVLAKRPMPYFSDPKLS